MSGRRIGTLPHMREVSLIADSSRTASTVTSRTTTVTTVATRIVTPSDAKYFVLRHLDSEAVWIGKDANIVVGGDGAWPLLSGDTLELEQFLTDDANSIWAIVSNGTVDVYCLGLYIE